MQYTEFRRLPRLRTEVPPLWLLERPLKMPHRVRLTLKWKLIQHSSLKKWLQQLRVLLFKNLLSCQCYQAQGLQLYLRQCQDLLLLAPLHQLDQQLLYLHL